MKRYKRMKTNPVEIDFSRTISVLASSKFPIFFKLHFGNFLIVLTVTADSDGEEEE